MKPALYGPHQTLTQKVVQTRGSSLYALLLIVAPVVAGLGGWRTAEILRAPDPGLACSAMTNKVMAREQRWAGVRTGDEILEVGGVPVRTCGQFRAAFLERQPGPVTLRVRRAQREWTTEARVELPSWPLKTTFWLRVLTGLTLLLIGSTVFFLRPGERVSWLFLVFCSALGGNLLTYMALYVHPRPGLMLELFSLLVVSASGLHLFAVFPTALDVSRRWPLIYLPYGIVALALGLLGPAGALGALRVTFRVGTALVALASVGCAVLAWGQYRRAGRTGHVAAQARSRAVLVAVALGLLVPGLYYGARQGLGLSTHVADGIFNSLPVVFFAGLTGYALVRHNALEVDRFTAAIVGYGATSAVLVLAFGVLLAGIPAVGGQVGWFQTPAAGAAAAAAFFLLFNPLYRRIRRRIDHLFRREDLAEDTALRLLREVVDSVKGTDTTSSFRIGARTALTLEGETATIWTKNAEGAFAPMKLDDAAGAPPPDGPHAPLPADGPLAQALAHGAGGIQGLADQAFDSAAQEELWARELALAAPLVVSGGLAGFVAVGRKRSGSGYSQRERLFLETLASHLSLALERDAQPGLRLGTYRVLGRLGTGGMAEVLLAEKHGPGGFERRAALKRLLPHLSQRGEYVNMFLDEARIAAQLHHPHIVQVYDIEKAGDTYFLAMEYVEGVTLDLLLASLDAAGELLPLDVTVAIVTAVLSALEYVHERKDRQGRPLGLVHRDVKPGNVLLGREGEVKLSDFGIARAEFKLHQTAAGTAKGTPAYMAPEQTRGDAVSPRSDLFSAAAVIYRLLTGQLAFPKGYAGRLPQPPCRVVPELPPAMDGFMARGLAAAPDERFASAREMRAALLAAMAPVTSAPAERLAALLEPWLERPSLDPVQDLPTSHPTQGRTIAGRQRGA